jgi:hypothetical protein
VTAIPRPLRRTEITVAEVVAALHQLAAEENWPEVWKAERLSTIQAPADRLVETARGVQLDATIAKWVAKVRSLLPDMARHSGEVLEEKITNYTFI